jgi:hypothetical protein
MIRNVRMTSFSSRPNLLDVHPYALVLGIIRRYCLIPFSSSTYTAQLRELNATEKYV